MEQVIYSRYEYPIGELTSTHEIFTELRNMYPAEFNENNVQVGGIGYAIRTIGPRSVILLTYDEESDLFLRLKHFSWPGLIYTNLRK